MSARSRKSTTWSAALPTKVSRSSSYPRTCRKSSAYRTGFWSRDRAASSKSFHPKRRRPNQSCSPPYISLELPAAVQKRLEGAERRSGDVMLDALGVRLRRFARGPNGDEQVDHQPMALARAFRHRCARLGQEDPPVGLSAGQPLALQASDGLAGGGVGDAHAPRNVGRARFTVGGDQVRDQFGVVLQQRG